MEVPSPISNPGELSSDPSSVIAAVDLGSNSFHMVVAQDQHGQLKVIDRIREMVRLGAGLNSSGKLSKESKERAIECLQRFGQRLQEMHADSVRVVGTNTLRVAKKSAEFIQRAEEALGHPIQIISGVEEARLIYQGTIHSLTGPEGKWLVVDIGGGSTEVIIGMQGNPLLMESVEMGCVMLSEKYFSNGELDKKRFKKALVEAKLQLQPIVSTVKELGWKHVVGTAGTIRTISELMREFELSERGITYKGINALIVKLQEAEHIDKVNFESLSKERKPVFAGGLVALKAIFEALDIKQMVISDGGLREGLLFDLAGRIHHQDTRDRTVYSLMRRYHVDFKHAANIKTTALHLLDKISKVWKINNDIAYQFLIWAADLHEIGLDIAHSKYHRHGAYLLDNSDLMGFSWNEQRLLACLVRSHRRKIDIESIEQLPARWQELAMFMIVILRVAVLINRDRVPKKLPDMKIEGNDGSLIIQFDKKWLEAHPLTEAELEQEQGYLKILKVKVSI
ncbi:MAG: exopolyphosphatase [Gammaproteobacteria bacterium]|nr:MAG: exopolyphosphatase [Gammaproteobacteria bacterium]